MKEQLLRQSMSDLVPWSKNFTRPLAVHFVGLAIQQVLLGQVDDLGGGVFKKRLNNNEHRSIILAKGGKYWIYEYLFAKKDRENIENDELLAFRLLAKSYAGLTAHQVGQLLVNGSFVEICHDDKTEIQE